MVNVGGRSKACDNCKRRRIACDATRPSCSRCRKSRLKCEGYERATVFVHEDPKSRHEQRLIRATIKSSQGGGALEVPRYFHPSGLPTAEDYAQLSYLFKSLHVTDEKSPSVRWPEQNWLIEQNPTSTASLALRALAATFFGRLHSHAPSYYRGAALYGQALTGLARDLSGNHAQLDLTHILAALNMSMFEMAVPTSVTAWSKHIQGVQYMFGLELFTPHDFQPPIAHAIFRRARSVASVQALTERKRSFLESHEWRTVPWARDPTSKSTLDRLVDIMTFVPGLLEDEDRITFLRDSRGREDATYNTLLEDIRGRILMLLIQLYRLRWAWEVMNPAVCYEVPEPADSPFAPHVLAFVSLTRANEITLYNSILHMLLDMSEILEVPMPDPETLLIAKGPQPVSQNPLRLPGKDDSPRAAVTEICRCAQFHLADPTNMAGPYFLLFPLTLARREFAGEPAERRWIEKLLDRITEKTVLEAEVVAR